MTTLAPPAELGLVDEEIEAPLVNVEPDRVAGLGQRERTADGRLRRDVQDHSAVRRPAHPRVADPHHVLDPALSSLAGIGRWPHSGMPGRAHRTAVSEHQDAVGGDVEIGVVDSLAQVVDVLEDDCTALVLQQLGVGRRELHHGAVRTQTAVENDQAAACVERPVARADHVGVDDLGAGDVLADRVRRDRQRVQVQQVGDLGHDGRQPARVVEVLHQVAARRA